MKNLWKPIDQLPPHELHSNNLLLCAPELVDEDCNPFGIGMGYYADDRDQPYNRDGRCGDPNVNYGGFLACKWNMTADEWYEEKITPTHFIILEGP